MYFDPASRANRKAEQAADKSNPNALHAPTLLAIKHAVAGNNISGVTVAHIIKSTVSACVLVFFLITILLH